MNRVTEQVIQMGTLNDITKDLEMLQKVTTLNFETGEATDITQDVNIGLPFLQNILRPSYQRMRARGTNHTAIFFGGYAFELWYEILMPPNKERVRRWHIHFGYGMDDAKREQTQNKVVAAFRLWGCKKLELSWIKDRNQRTLLQIDELDIIGLV